MVGGLGECSKSKLPTLVQTGIINRRSLSTHYIQGPLGATTAAPHHREGVAWDPSIDLVDLGQDIFLFLEGCTTAATPDCQH